MIDFDRSTLRIPATGWREGNLARLRRSLLKLRGHRSIKEVEEDFARLRKGYDAQWDRGICWACPRRIRFDGLVGALPRCRQCLGGRDGTADGNPRTRRALQLRHSLRPPRPERVPRPIPTTDGRP